MSGFLVVKNWQKFQHYHDRSPRWIKLYRDTLADYAFSCLHDASKMHLVGIWLLASEQNGQVPNDPDWIARRIGATEPVNLQVLIEAGFLSLARRKQDASTPLAKRLPREEKRREETSSPTKAGHPTWLTPFSEAWKSHRGQPNYGRLASVLRPIVEQRGEAQVRLAWEGYLDERHGKGFCTVEDFASNYEHYRQRWAVEILEDGTERALADAPTVAA